jgi:type II protein arginine methyltransferase
MDGKNLAARALAKSQAEAAQKRKQDATTRAAESRARIREVVASESSGVADAESSEGDESDVEDRDSGLETNGANEAENWLALQLHEASALVEGGKHRTAFELFDKIFQVAGPQCGVLVETAWIECVLGVAREVLHESGWADMLKLYGRAVRSFPCSGIFHNLAGECASRGIYGQAIQCYREALRLSPSSQRSREDLESILNATVERWHFKMLNDRARNEAYRTAIERAVRRASVPVHSVLDIGAGTALLSMMAVTAGAARAYAVEVTPEMARVAQEVVQENGMSEQISVLNCHSTAISVGGSDPGIDSKPTICERVSLVVTETVDAGLLGEGIWPSLQHARRELLCDGPAV